LIRSVEEVEIETRRVLLRVDFDCPLRDGAVLDDARIRAALPTIRHALNRRAKVVMLSHLGSPGGRHEAALSLEPVGARLAELLDMDVVLADDCVGDGARKVVADLYGGQIAMLENLGFQPGEASRDERFARQIAALGEVYVGEAFAVAHRTDASISILPGLVAERCAGLALKREMESLARLRGDVKHPFVAILGGARVPDKFRLIHGMMGRLDAILAGGVVANTFLAASGRETGDSLVEKGCLVQARGILEEARKRSVSVALPVDLVVTGAGSEETSTVPADRVPAGRTVLDVGPATVSAFGEVVASAATIFWNGPLGMCERPPFDSGTRALAEAVGRSLAWSVVAGGDSVSAVRAGKLEPRFGHVSTSGGAGLAYLGGEDLPGIRALEV